MGLAHTLRICSTTQRLDNLGSILGETEAGRSIGLPKLAALARNGSAWSQVHAIRDDPHAYDGGRFALYNMYMYKNEHPEKGLRTQALTSLCTS